MRNSLIFYCLITLLISSCISSKLDTNLYYQVKNSYQDTYYFLKLSADKKDFSFVSISNDGRKMDHAEDIIWMNGKNVAKHDYFLTLKPDVSLVGIISHDFQMCDVQDFEYDSLFWYTKEILSPVYYDQRIVFPCYTVQSGSFYSEYIEQEEGIIFPVSIKRVKKFDYSKLKRKQRKIAKALLEEKDIEKAKKIIERGKKY